MLWVYHILEWAQKQQIRESEEEAGVIVPSNHVCGERQVLGQSLTE